MSKKDFKIGQKVKLKEDLKIGHKKDSVKFLKEHEKFREKKLTISSYKDCDNTYQVKEDFGNYWWHESWLKTY